MCHWLLCPCKGLGSNVVTSVLQTCQGPPASGEAGSTSSSGTTASPARAVVVTKDHLAMFPEERMRIEKAGGQVTADGRLDGRIQVCSSVFTPAALGAATQQSCALGFHLPEVYINVQY